MPRPSAAAAATPAPLISNQQLTRLYVMLLRTRLLRERNRTKNLAASLVAREAIVTGTVTHLREGDTVMPLPGDRLAALGRGHHLRRIMSSAPLPGILPSAPMAEVRFAIAAGYAMARRGTDEITLAFGGPGITSLEPLRPALSYAGQHKLGVVFVVETAAEADLSSARRTEPLGLYGIPVDGNDVIALYRVAQESIQRARRGSGPTLIDCKPWPLAAKQDGSTDPIRRLEQALERRGLAASALKKRTIAAFRNELSTARKKRGEQAPKSKS
jgi:TPP-dependent pyruvate/acetoin dehydrogenase alpha subunit